MSIVNVMKTFHLGIIILILFIESCAKAPSQFYDALSERIPKDDQGLFLKAIAHQKKGQIDPAIGLWEKFLGKYPDSYEARNNLGFLYYANDQINQAITQFEQGLNLEVGSVKIKDNLVRALKVRVVIFEENNEFHQAISDLKRIKQLSSVGQKEKIERQIEVFEDKIFEEVKKTDLREEYEEFLKKYPNSPRNSDEAKLWLRKSRGVKEVKLGDQLLVPEPSKPENLLGVTVGSFTKETSENTEETATFGVSPTATKTPKTSAEETVLLSSPKMVEVIKPNLINMHSEPKIESGNIVQKLKTGTQIIYIGENARWYQVEFANGEKGWVIKKYTKLLE